jgi:four helix bundle protein
MNQVSRQADLRKRTQLFSENIITLFRSFRPTFISRPIISQLIRSATSIGANSTEACGASSEKDFKYKIHTCKKEAEETKYWLNLLLKCSDEHSKEITQLQQEAHEFVLIFQKALTTLLKKT